MATVTDIKNHLTGMGHGGTLNKVRNFEHLLERAADVVNSRIDAVETQREQQLSQAVHDDLYRYSLPSDYKKIIDLFPVEDAQKSDVARRTYTQRLRAERSIKNKIIAIGSSEGTKFIRIDWQSRAAKTLHTMDSITEDGDIAVVTGASGLKINELYKLSGSASIEFDLDSSGGGISVLNKDIVLDLDDWDEQADFIVPVYLGSVTNFTSATLIWGNDITTKFWTPTAQTAQADGTAVRVGWNYFLFPWSTATETGTVTPATIDSFRLTIASTGAITNVRVDNILVSLGRFFDLNYYSQFAFRTSAGVWIQRPTSDTDSVVYIGTAFQIYLLECLVLMAQQMEGTDSAFDINFAKAELLDLYPRYKAEHPSEGIKQVGRYWNSPRIKR